ncbi:peptidase inhibitor family I36 protein [Streptomyces iconiensis]|uniref:Peptidase inhibitor family I36 protein n=1 Tax=Streptomyces iconiensis TaxID=1384038 RepID=A0ABT7A8N3_9ACTN|nr:peptidase inhibitor family I36 protein [Streptomyces iconiensis]MDJ1137707.1 peptidase inhibitor family I36 protein [Streptomyces iconiensis]
MNRKIALVAASTALLFASAVGSASAQERTEPAGNAGAPAGVIKPVQLKTAEARIAAWDNCLHGQACLFQNKDGNANSPGQTMYVVPSCNRVYTLDSSMNNRASSLWNRAGSTLNIYNGNGGVTMLGSYGAFGPPINLPTNFNDKISSVYAPC